MKCEKKITEGIELLNQKNIRTLGEKGNEMYFGIPEVDTIKQAEMKEVNNEKSTWGEGENFSKPNSTVEISLKGKTPGESTFKVTRDYY